jgi:hypothetical protein
MTRIRKKGEASSEQKDGGVIFFLSYLCLIIIFITQLMAIPEMIDKVDLARLAIATLGALFGYLTYNYLIHGRLHVIFHEQRHRLLSNLVGNREKSFNVDENSGSFEYAYSKHTAHMNTFIALAPYCLPMASIVLTIIAAFIGQGTSGPMLLALGFGLAFDISGTLRDIGPHQSDLSNIRGGYKVAFGYVIIMNAVILAASIAWILCGYQGLQLQLLSWFKIYALFA